MLFGTINIKSFFDGGVKLAFLRTLKLIVSCQLYMLIFYTHTLALFG